MSVTEHLNSQAIEDYRARRSSAAEFLAAQRHIAACAECRARLAAAVEADSTLMNLRGHLTPEDDDSETDSHLPYEQLAMYLDGHLDEVEREIADSHLSFCEDCAADLADLRQYEGLAASPSLKPAAHTSPVGTPSIRQRFAALLGTLMSPLPAAVAAALIFIVLGGVWLATRDGRTPQEDESAQLKPGTYAPPTVPERTTTPSPTPSLAETHATPTGDSADRTAPAPVDKPRTPPGVASPLVALNDGGARVAVDRQGRIDGLEEVSSDVRQAVSRALRSRRIEIPSTLDGLAEGDGTLMGSGAAGASFAPQSPVGKIVRQTSPLFSWSPLAGAKAYTVSIVDSKFRPVAQSRSLNQTSWTPAAQLTRGAVYSWQVTATLEDGTQVTAPAAPAPQARFRVLDAETDGNLKRLEQKTSTSRLARGVAYARAGLLDEAEVELKELLKQNPDSQVAHDLLRSLRQPSRPKRTLP